MCVLGMAAALVGFASLNPLDVPEFGRAYFAYLELLYGKMGLRSPLKQFIFMYSTATCARAKEDGRLDVGEPRRTYIANASTPPSSKPPIKPGAHARTRPPPPPRLAPRCPTTPPPPSTRP